MPTVLIVDDQKPVARALAVLLELHGIDSVIADGPESAERALDRAHPHIDLVLQDMNFSPGRTSGTEGRQLFESIRSRRPDLPVLLMTAWASLETAVRLMRAGASDYIEKPWNDDTLVTTIRDLLRETKRDHESDRNQRLQAETARRYDLCGLVYQSAAMQELVALAVRVARADVPVLITGANGTGKEKLAELVRANSSRRQSAFVKVNVGALPDSLLEAELFGAEAGAFTGASKRRIGRFEAADRGTLLLDEIGTLSANGQVKLLRVLQTGEFERLGSSRPRRVDVRVIAATNTDLRRAISEGSFREDLFFRLNVIELRVPMLHQRPEDILPLAEHFLASSGHVLDARATQRLLGYHWPGNVRELRNAMERAVIVASGRTIGAEDLHLEQGTNLSRRPHARTENPTADTERQHIESVLDSSNGVVAHAARQLGLSRQALYRRMDRLGITIERRVKD